MPPHAKQLSRTSSLKSETETNAVSQPKALNLQSQLYFSDNDSVFTSSSKLIPCSGTKRCIDDKKMPVPREDEPNLHNFPDDLHPSYRPLPAFAKFSVVLTSIALAGLFTWGRDLASLSPLLALDAEVHTWDVMRLLAFVATAAIAAVIQNMILQDVFLPPSRIPTSTLFEKYFTPSSLSRIKPVTMPSGEELGVHHLQYDARTRDENVHRFRAVYVNHGFTASSLSWLPVLPSLVERTGARVGLGHDAPGFGFTERPTDDSGYKFEASAHIGSALLSSHILQTPVHNSQDAVLLLGHSMGSFTTLRMALTLPPQTRKVLVLVAPALGLRPRLVCHINRWLTALTCPTICAIRSHVMDPILGYILRRIVGKQNVWKDCIKIMAFSDPDRVSESDALRFQWPSVLHGWEHGVLSFLRAQLTPSSDKLMDAELFEQVLSLPNTSVTVIQGTADLVVPRSLLDKFLQPHLDRIKVVYLEGQAHDPFEEDVDLFVDAIEDILLEEGIM